MSAEGDKYREHFAEAERLLYLVENAEGKDWVPENLAAAQVHATLALAAATCLR